MYGTTRLQAMIDADDERKEAELRRICLDWYGRKQDAEAAARHATNISLYLYTVRECRRDFGDRVLAGYVVRAQTLEEMVAEFEED